MLSTEVIDAYRSGKKITHSNGNSYRIKYIGMMKEHGVWHECAVYQEVKGSGRVFVRSLMNFINFTCAEDIILTKQDTIKRYLLPSPLYNFWEDNSKMRDV